MAALKGEQTEPEQRDLPIPNGRERGLPVAVLLFPALAVRNVLNERCAYMRIRLRHFAVSLRLAFPVVSRSDETYFFAVFAA